MIKVITVNLNGIRSAGKKNFFAWAKTQHADLICIQEVRATEKQLNDPAFHLDGYTVYSSHAQKSGYNYNESADLGWDFFGTATGWFVKTTGKPAITVELSSHNKSDWEINKPALLDIISSSY